MKISKRSVAAGTIGAVAASGLGLVLLGAPSALAAATTDSSGTSASSGTDSRLQAIEDALAGLVTGGTLTQSQADEVATTLDSSDALRGGGRAGHGGGRVVDLDTAATTIGLSTDDLRTALQADGATLVTVASDHDVTEQTLVDALVAAAKTHLTEEVTEGDLTQAEADDRIAALPTTVKQAVESTFAGRGGHDDTDSTGTTGTGTSSSSSSSSSSNTSHTTTAKAVSV